MRGGLDRANQLDGASEIGFSAQVNFGGLMRGPRPFKRLHNRFAGRVDLRAQCRNVFSAVTAAPVAAMHVFRSIRPV